MTITLSDVKKAAELAKLRIDEKEEVEYLRDFRVIFKLAQQMEEVDTKSIQPVAHCFDIAQRLRTDVVTEINQRESLQQLTKQTTAGFYCVPPVIE